MNDVEKMMVLSAGLLVGNGLVEPDAPTSKVQIWMGNASGSYINVTNRTINFDFGPNLPVIRPSIGGYTANSGYVGYNNLLSSGCYFYQIGGTPDSGYGGTGCFFNAAFQRGCRMYQLNQYNLPESGFVTVGFNCQTIKKAVFTITGSINRQVTIQADGSGGYTADSGYNVELGSMNLPHIIVGGSNTSGFFGTALSYQTPGVPFAVGAKYVDGSNTWTITSVETD